MTPRRSRAKKRGDYLTRFGRATLPPDSSGSGAHGASSPHCEGTNRSRRPSRRTLAQGLALVVANYLVEAFDHVWIGITAGHVEYGSRNLAGRIETDPQPRGVGVHVFDSRLTVQDCLLSGNRCQNGPTEDGHQLAGETALVSYSRVQGLPVGPDDAGNLGTDPQFVDRCGVDGIVGTEDDDLHLLSSSPCINTGDPTTVAVPREGDLDSSRRVPCGRVDMGAFEFGSGDYDCNRVIDLGDFTHWLVCVTGPAGAPYGGGCEAFDFNADAHSICVIPQDSRWR